MRRRLPELVALLVTLVATQAGLTPRLYDLHAQAPAPAPVSVAFLYSDGNLPGTLKAFKAILEERPDLKGKVELRFLTESVFDETKPAQITSSKVLVLDMMNQQMLDRYNAKYRIDVIQQVRRGGQVLAIGEGLLPKERYISQGAILDDTARAFWAHSGFKNQVGLLKLALTRAGVKGLVIPKPEPSLEFGYYYPDGRDGRVFATWDEFAAWTKASGKQKPGAPRIALGFYKSSYYSGETELLDAVIAEIERRGGNAIPFFGYPDVVAASRLLVDQAGAPRADAALSLLFRFAGPEASGLMEKVDIPVVNLISLYGRSEQEWRASSTGLSFFEGTFQVAVPELAGLVAPTVIGSQEKVFDKDTGLTVVVRKPIASQVTSAVQRGLKFAALRRIANKDKHVAILFYDYPAGKANIGASYLNVAESIAQILGRLQKEGYDLGPGGVKNGDAVLKDLAEKARNVGGYAPGELQALVKQGAAVQVGMAEYKRWLDGFAPTLRAKILQDWGAPEKAKQMRVDGAKGPAFVLPVVRYGKVVLMPQPARGWGEDLDKMYHAKDLAPPHQYVAGYAWLRNGFKADAVVHVGTHGTLEWLDGKDMGLSSDDAPDALIADIPDLYIYNVDVVGEGLVARRRGMATLIDHMVPPFKKGGLLPDLSELSENISDYEKRKADNPELARAYGERIRTRLISLGIAKDLGLKLDT
ncbi:MAG TPA: cobaltochelatase subunit CobN, partial [Vicinamibacterales bacterium]|nr:cobaltochelatase subunit CobN [Vicinamibacterales bacterium]